MSDILSQEEIDALLNANKPSDETPDKSEDEVTLTGEEKDALGEIGNISMGTAATTLFTLLNKKVTITTPQVSLTTMEKLAHDYPSPYVAVEISYTEGLEGNNVLIMKNDDVKIITSLMMGGNGEIKDGEISEMELSAIAEVMNQMIGSSSTSLSAIIKKSVNISPPKASIIDFTKNPDIEIFKSEEKLVKILFKMQVENLIDSEIMQLLPLSFAKDLVNGLLNPTIQQEEPKEQPKQEIKQEVKPETKAVNQNAAKPVNTSVQADRVSARPKQKVNVQPAAFQSFDEPEEQSNIKENIDFLLDVPLQISVELGKTKKLIKDILELTSGSVIELDKLAGDPVDIICNGKMIAKGEVVVIDENFGVRITDIISPSQRV